jgi:hypothetical protein
MLSATLSEESGSEVVEKTDPKQANLRLRRSYR